MRQISRLRMRTTYGALSLLFAAVLLAAGLAGCGTGASADPLAAVTVNGHAISLADYSTILAVYKAGAARQGQGQDWQNPTGRANLVSTEQQTLDFLVNLELAREQLTKPLTSADTKTDRDRLNQIRGTLAGNSQDAASHALAATLTPRAIALLAEQQAIQDKLVQQLQMPTYRVRGILVKTLKEAQDYQKQAQQGADFGQLARAHSLDTASAAQGGDLGTIYPGQLGPSFDAVAFAKNARPQKYEIILTSGNYALLELTQPGRAPLKGVSDAQQQATIFSAWLTDIIRPQAKIQRNISLG
ncbi:MAG: peptidylprolyl isomerase [Ktedonobacterales bacterium]|nr:peptidylprolyl isomerase [Ktedonobacterales bacterium]